MPCSVIRRIDDLASTVYIYFCDGAKVSGPDFAPGRAVEIGCQAGIDRSSCVGVSLNREYGVVTMVDIRERFSSKGIWNPAEPSTAETGINVIGIEIADGQNNPVLILYLIGRTEAAHVGHHSFLFVCLKKSTDMADTVPERHPQDLPLKARNSLYHKRKQ